jgi:putative FmdB family regulatory protein
MPIYDYQCKACGHRFEQLVKIDAKAPTCPSCGKARTERLFSFSATVSTDKTREHALKGARAKAGAQKKEKDHAHQVYLRNHMKDHS